MDTPGKRDKTKMSEKKVFTVPLLDLECLLSAKVTLQQQGLLDPVLKATLEHATQALERLPVAKRRDVSLLLEGETQLVRFIAGTPSLHYTARLGADGPELHQKVHSGGAGLASAAVSDAHFSGHRCQDEFVSCLERARQALGGEDGDVGLTNVELRVVCGELRLTYSTDQPVSSVVIQPRRRVNLGPALTLEKTLKVKNHLEQSGATGKGLLACLQYLLVNYTQYQSTNTRIVLQSNGEMMELISGSPEDQNILHYIFTDADDKVHSHKVQDIDLWDYD